MVSFSALANLEFLDTMPPRVWVFLGFRQALTIILFVLYPFSFCYSSSAVVPYISSSKSLLIPPSDIFSLWRLLVACYATPYPVMSVGWSVLSRPLPKCTRHELPCSWPVTCTPINYSNAWMHLIQWNIYWVKKDRIRFESEKKTSFTFFRLTWKSKPRKLTLPSFFFLFFWCKRKHLTQE